MAKRTIRGDVKSTSRTGSRRATSARNVGLLSGRTRGVKKGRAQRAKPAALSIDKRISRAILNMKEPKYVSGSFTGQSVGQLNVNATGSNTNNLSTLMPVSGDGVNQRDGVQIIGRYFKFGISLWQQTNCHASVTIKFYLVRQFGETPLFAIGELFRSSQALSDLNAIPVYDTTVMRNQFYNENYEIVGSHEVTIERGNGNTFNAMQTKFFVSLDDQLVQFVDGTATPKNTLFTLVAVASYGNKNATTPGTMLGVPENAATSGILYNVSAEFGYKDV